MPVKRSAVGNLLRALEITGYLAVWPALYLWAAASLFTDLTGRTRPDALASIFLMSLAVSVYLVDRVKLGDRFLDPADADTHPARHAWLWKHRVMTRALAGGCAVVAMVTGFLLHPVLAGAPVVGQIAVFAYSGLPAGTRSHFARLKDIPFIKNLAGSLGVTTIAVLAARHIGTPETAIADLAPVGVVVLLVFADCMLCDVGDAPGDGPHGTRTIPVLFGTRAGRLMASVLAVAAGGLMWWLEPGMGSRWAVAIGLSQVVLAVLPGTLIRNGTDLRLPMIAGVLLLVH